MQTLGVSDVVVCGHSYCGAMASLLNDSSDKQSMPSLFAWLKWAAPVRKLIKSKYGHLKSEAERITAAAEENVLLGLENLRQYPAVKARLEEGNLRLHGWFFHISTAEIFAYDPVIQQFQRITSPVVSGLSSPIHSIGKDVGKISSSRKFRVISDVGRNLLDHNELYFLRLAVG